MQVPLAIELGPGGLLVAFAAGFVSFISPCVLPLVPGYLSFVSGVGFGELGARTRRVVTSTAAFVAGFTAVFVLLGIGSAWFGSVLLENRRSLEVVSGAFLLAAALVIAGIPLPIVLAAERRFAPRLTGGVAEGGRATTAALIGAAFAVGWTPCIGPTLGAILTLSFAGGATEGAVLLGVYSLGLGLPFLLFGLLFTRALGLAKAVRRSWRAVSLASAMLLAAFGVLLITGELVDVTARLSRFTDLQI